MLDFSLHKHVFEFCLKIADVRSWIIDGMCKMKRTTKLQRRDYSSSKMIKTNNRPFRFQKTLVEYLVNFYP